MSSDPTEPLPLARREDRLDVPDEPSPRPASLTLRQGLWILILVLVALLALAITSALVNQSLAVFILVSIACWGLVFAGAFALSRNISRQDRRP
jgi:hypothetical protein